MLLSYDLLEQAAAFGSDRADGWGSLSFTRVSSDLKRRADAASRDASVAASLDEEVKRLGLLRYGMVETGSKGVEVGALIVTSPCGSGLAKGLGHHSKERFREHTLDVGDVKAVGVPVESDDSDRRYESREQAHAYEDSHCF